MRKDAPRERPARRPALTDHRAASRVSAYVYGDVLVLAAGAGAPVAAIRSGQAVALVVGTVVSTYLAHVLADVAGAVFSGAPLAATLRAEVRDAVPVLSAGGTPLVLFAAAAAGWLGPVAAQVLATAVTVLRIAALGLVYRRVHGGIGFGRALWAGMVAAGVAAVVTGVKLVLVH